MHCLQVVKNSKHVLRAVDMEYISDQIYESTEYCYGGLTGDATP